MNQPVFYFDEYRVRPVMEADRTYIDRLTANDTYHAGCMDADWFLNLVPGEDAWAVEDRDGKVVAYFKTQTAVRLSMQFAGADSSENRRMLEKGMTWIEAMLIQNKFREVIFDTKGPLLAAMAKRRLGFAEGEPGTLYKLLPSPASTGPLEGHWHHQPTASQKAG